MQEPGDQRVVLEIRLYGLPHGTDGDALTQKAHGLAENLEELGCFEQRDHEPAHRFILNGDKRR